jgi:hypothetical protein
MYVRPKLAGMVAALVTSAALFLSGCSSSQPRDINYGTDVGVGYVPSVVTPTDGAAINGASIDAGASADTAMDVMTSSDNAVDAAVLDVEVPDVASVGGDT